jgi:hypothetical protein
MNVMMLVEAVLHILQQGCSKGTLSFEAPDQVIKNISKGYGCRNKKILNIEMESMGGETPENEGHY